MIKSEITDILSKNKRKPSELLGINDIRKKTYGYREI